MKTTVLICSVLSLVLTASQSASSAETKPTPAKVVPAQLDGTIIALNKKDRSVTVDVNGKLLTVNVTRQLKLSRNGQPAKFDELAPGQPVTITFIETADGQIEVAALTIASSPESLESAGPKGRGNANRNVPILPPQAPFTSPPNPANNGGGPAVSPHQ